jgi:signal transduction histidine kinase
MKNRFFINTIFCCFFFYCQSSFSQKKSILIDSLKIELTKNISDSLKGETFFNIAKLYRKINNDSALFYSNKVELIAKNRNYISLLGRNHNLKGSLNYDISNNEIALENFYKSLRIYKKLNSYRSLGIVYNKLAIVHRNLYNLDSALFYNYKTLKVFDSLKMINYAMYARNNIANIFNKLGNKEKALKEHLYILKIRDSLKDTRGVMHSLGNLGDTYADLNNFDESKKYYSRGIEIAKKTKDSVAMARFYNNQASLFTDNNDLKNGLKYFKKALDIRVKFNDLYGVSSSFLNIAKIQLMTQKSKFAEKNLRKTISISQKNDLKDHLQEGYDLMSRVKLLLNENDSSFHYQRLSTNLLDSISKKEFSKKLAELDIKYQSEKKEKELLQVRTEKVETELSLAKTKIWTYILISGLVLSVLLFFTLNQRNKRKNQEEILKQKEHGLKALIEAQETERSRIARELHDGVVQEIGSIILRSRNLFSKLNVSKEKESEDLLMSLENSNKDLRNISHQMMPRALKELGVVAALKDLLEGSLVYSNIKYTLEHFNIEKKLPEKIEITIYRITQELINNIIKHSKATGVSVQLYNTNNIIILIVEDNGVGLHSEESNKGVGLLNISSRLDMVNGNVNFEPSPKSGTLVTIKIPL